MSKKEKHNHAQVKAPNTVYEAMQLSGEMLRRLVNNQASVGEAKAACGLINSMQAGLHLRQEQARLTGMRLNSDILPDVQFDPNATPAKGAVIEMKPAKVLNGKKSKAA